MTKTTRLPKLPVYLRPGFVPGDGPRRLISPASMSLFAEAEFDRLQYYNGTATDLHIAEPAHGPGLLDG